jgi:hypothetical protein
MDIKADVALGGDERLAAMDSDPDPYRPRLERPLTVLRRGNRVRCPCERDEERVALRVDLDAAVARERLPQHAPMLAERAGVIVP